MYNHASMNRVFRVVWNASLGVWQAVGEIGKGAGKGTSDSRKKRHASALAGAVFLISTQVYSASLPTNGVVSSGSGSISQQGNTLNITQNSNKMAIDWQSFSVGKDNSVNFIQPSSSSIALNRVIGNDVSSIQGAINANGQVFLINPNGVLFSTTAQVNVGGLVASTRNITNEQFNAGNFKFEGSNSNAIINQGNIKTADGGYVVMIAAKIENTGKITANNGTVGLAAGNLVTVDMGGPVKLKVEQGAINALISNGGAIKADAGHILLTAKAAGDLAASVINNTGNIEAGSLTKKGGKIELTGDIISQGGTLDASSSQNAGGQIVSQASLIIDSGVTKADGKTDGGSIEHIADDIQQVAAATLSASGKEGKGGQVSLKGGTQAYLSGKMTATGKQQGGKTHITANRVTTAGLQVDTSGQDQAGKILIGGGWQGKDSSIDNASKTVVDGYTILTNKGNGGTVVAWSDDKTVFGATIDAPNSAVEVSSKDSLTFGTSNIKAKSLLLDPKNIEVKDVSGGLDYIALYNPNNVTGDSFGSHLIQLSSGNIVITALSSTIGGLSDVGAVYLYSSIGSLISTLTGSSTGDYVGNGGVTTLTNGNYVVRSSGWDNGTVTNAGAVTWGNGTSGVSGVVSSSNSLVGSSTNDTVGGSGIVALTNGNYVVRSPNWDNGTVTDAGAVTWGNGTSGVSGVVSSSNSLVGSSPYDSVGNGGVTALTNGNYVVSSQYWDNGTVINAGAVTWGNGSSGVSGTVSSSNSLVGSSTSDNVGNGGVTALTNGNYVVRSQVWDNGTVVNAGAVTWGNGTSGVSGVVSSSNSLVGSSADDNVGGSGILVALTNGNYVVSSQFWDNGTVANAGAVTWGNGTSGVSGVVSSSNSLVGSSTGDSVGNGGVTTLTNGNYVVRSSGWDNGTVTNAGAVTWGNGTSGVSGVVSSSNSLVGSSTNDSVGGSGSVTALTNGNYVVNSRVWDNGTVTNAGAVTWGNGTSGVSGTIDSSNSLVGSSTSDSVGGSGIVALTNGNYVVSSQDWDNGTVVNAGAVTWGNGSSGVSGTVSSSNSLVGSSTNDIVGSSGIVALTNGNYVVRSPGWDNGTVTNAGAVTWGNGTSGVSGVVSSSNSLVGSSTSDSVGGAGGVTALTNGNYVVSSTNWDNGTVTNAGAVTWGSGTSGVSGVVSSANSVLGAYASAQLGVSIMSFSDSIVIKDTAYNDGTHTGGAVFLTSGSVSSGSADPASSATFTNNPSANSTITPSSITAILNLGTAVTLQANNDITITNAVTANNGSGHGGTFKLQAGRNININNSITTDDGDFIAVAGATGADVNNKDAGAPTITLGTNGSINAGTGKINLIARGTGAGFTNNSTVNNAIQASIASIYLPTYNVAASGNISAQTYFTKGNLTLSGKLYNTSYNQSTDIGSCGFANCVMPTSGINVFYAATPTLSVAPTTGQTSTYGGAFTASGQTYTGFVDNDADNTAGISGTATFTVGGTTSSSGKYIAGSHDIAYSRGLVSSLGYTFADASAQTGELTVAKKDITSVTSISASNKTYDRLTTASLVTSGAGFTGKVTNDVLTVATSTGAFADKNAADGKTVSIAGITLGGADADNYNLTSTTASTTANISKKALSITGLTASNKVYDGSTTATLAGTAGFSGVITNDTVTLSGTASGAFANKNVGAAKSITVSGLTLSGNDASNYTVGALSNTANITKASIAAVMGITASNKTYDGSATASLVTSGADFTGKISGDTLSVATSAGNFVDKNAGDGKTVSITGITLGGADAGNYTLTTNTASAIADISKARISAVINLLANDKVYDGNTIATLDTTNAAFTGMVTGDSLNVGSSNASFADAVVGNAKPVRVTNIVLGGTDANNYVLADATASLTADITPTIAPLPVVDSIVNSVLAATNPTVVQPAAIVTSTVMPPVTFVPPVGSSFGNAGVGIGGLSGGLAFVEAPTSPASNNNGTTTAPIVTNAGRDTAGFMRVGIVGGGISLPTQASETATNATTNNNATPAPANRNNQDQDQE